MPAMNPPTWLDERGEPSRVATSLIVLLLLLGGCSRDTERSWAYKYRYNWDESTVTPRVSINYRTREECETKMAEFSRFHVALDRCVLQPPISLGWIEWESSIGIKAQATGERRQESPFALITQSLGDCRKVRKGMLAVLASTPASMVNISASSCMPIYIGDRDGYTPLQVSDFEGILVRSRVEKK